MMDKNRNFSEWYNEIIRSADIIDDRYPIKGMPVYKPYGFKLVRNIIRNLEKELEKFNIEPAWFPALIHYNIFKKESEHIKGFESEVFWVGGKDEASEYVLRPTSETEMYYMYPLWIKSYSDLPIKLYMTNTVYRYETKATKPLIRGREVLWNEAHTGHSTKEDAERMINDSIKIYTKIFWEICSVPFVWTVRPSWDKFAGADYTKAADTILPDGRFLQIGTTHLLGQNFSKAFGIYFNDKHPFLSKDRKNEIEIKMKNVPEEVRNKIDDYDLIAFSKDYKKVVIIKILGNRAKIKIITKEGIEEKEINVEYNENKISDKISTGYREYELNYIYGRLEENERLIESLKSLINLEEFDNRKMIWQISFGLAMRSLAAVISIHGDNKGLVLPFPIAPIQIVIIPIYYSSEKEEKERILEYCEKVRNYLDEYRVYLDKDDSKTPGWKFNYYEFKGVPIRIEIGKKEVEENSVTVSVRRRNERSKKYYVKIEELKEKIRDIVEEYDKYLKEEAIKYFKEKIVKTNNISELTKIIEENKVGKIPFCMSEECAKELKERYSLDIKGYDINPEKTNERCIVCGKEGKYWVYVGRSY
ncbi:MAG: proline--tRNA ligase [Candidatus Nanoclepta minutus]|uniref:proline--tRNA ligase n=1 Tax=Candidatus Nanoclepta minutus TaxID=1940235 RepID=A0A397WMA9_9ARCH|nr:MAG: proline--tRNA ligase [Candidatus Nanoclepta minutus]